MAGIKDSWPIWIVLVIVAAIISFIVLKSPEKTPNKVSYTAKVDSMEAQESMAEESAVKESPIINAHPKTSRAGGMYSVQVYSFQDGARANSSLEDIKNKGYEDAYVLVSDLGQKGIWHRVRVGYFDDEASATEVLEKLRHDFNSGILVRN